MLTKSELRSQIRQKRKSLDEDYSSARSVSISERLFSVSDICDKDTYMLYSDFDNEVKTGSIYNKLRDMSKIVFMPVVSGDDILIYPVTDSMRINHFGILEPLATGTSSDPSDIDVFVVPGICFDRKGGRVGFGRGYYDRLLAFARSDAVKVGLAYDFQIVDDVCSEDHDIMMDYIITDKEIIRTREL